MALILGLTIAAVWINAVSVCLSRCQNSKHSALFRSAVFCLAFVLFSFAPSGISYVYTLGRSLAHNYVHYLPMLLANGGKLSAVLNMGSNVLLAFLLSLTLAWTVYHLLNKKVDLVNNNSTSIVTNNVTKTFNNHICFNPLTTVKINA